MKWFFPDERFEARVLLAPDGDGTGGEDPPADKTYTQAELEQIIQGRVAKNKKEADDAKAKLVKQETELADLRAKLANPPKPEDPPPTDLEGRIKLMESQSKRELAALQAKVDAAEKKAVDEENRRKRMERDREILDALTKAGCRTDALPVGLSYFASQVEYSDENSSNVFRMKSGGTVSVAEGIKEELPDYLKESSLQGGGSGSKSSSSKKVAQQNAIDAEKKKKENLYDFAMKSGKEADRLAYEKQKRRVAELEQQLAAT